MLHLQFSTKIYFIPWMKKEGCTSLMQLGQKNLDKKSKVIESPFSEFIIVYDFVSGTICVLHKLSVTLGQEQVAPG